MTALPPLSALLWQGFFVALAALVLIGLALYLRSAFLPPMPDLTSGQLEELYRKGAIDVNRYLALKDRLRGT